MTVSGFPIDDGVLREFCRRNRIRRLSVFGSGARGELRPDSDLDLLVEFEPGILVGLRFISIQEELSELFGRRVDLNTPGFLSRRFRARVLKEAVALYDAA